MLVWIILTICLDLTFNTSVYAIKYQSMGHEQGPGNSNAAPVQEISVNLDEQVAKPSVKVNEKVPNANSNEIAKNVEDTKNSKTKDVVDHKNEESSTVTTNVKKYSKDLLQSGALLRGFYVFIGLSAVVVFYFVYRSYRLRNGAQAPSTVRKYGVTARRSDLEMRRLELDDDDDDTIFEINQNVNR
ncbi:hypothetical protein PPYR_00936 [Photinus pyralis]|uniref:Uncharacterized protein n=1 Tax=Photinus pyralis TaxID=7054 RepID=A0A5N4B323_PHOPY|nr:uncharacterized protein LOC116166964 [Photinus pyralis]KAB0803966.1 hypothetical protein PPYR_00936 [Photinus pyralis]